MRFDASTGSIIAQETVENNENGITEVQSSSTISGDTLRVQSRYLKNGEWVPGHSVEYQRVTATPIKFH